MKKKMTKESNTIDRWMKVGVWRGEQLEALKNFNTELKGIRKEIKCNKNENKEFSKHIINKLDNIEKRITNQTIKVGVISGVLGTLSGTIGTLVMLIFKGLL